jgi:hypothetical protein
MAVEVQTLAGAAQFTGLPGAGLFDFSRYDNIPRTTRVVLTTLGYSELFVAAPLTTTLEFRAVRPGGTPTEFIILAIATPATMVTVDGNLLMRGCGIVVPREAGNGGAHWQVTIATTLKLETASATVDHVLCPYTDTDVRDSQQ